MSSTTPMAATLDGRAAAEEGRWRRPIYRLPHRRTHPMIWLVGILCSVLAVAVIVSGIAVFAGYLILKPKVPYIHISYARLERLDYYRDGNFGAQLTIYVTAVNDNAKATARFADLHLDLTLAGGPTLAKLVSKPFEVRRNSSLTLPYGVTTSAELVLDREQVSGLDASVRKNRIGFDLKGGARAMWKVGLIGFVKFWTRLSCRLLFSTDGTITDSAGCSSKHR